MSTMPSAKRPLIGITAYDYIMPKNNSRYDVSYGQNAAVVEQAGGLPVLIPSHCSPETLRAIYERLDGVLLPGGGDIDPRHYQQEAQGDVLKAVNPARDAMELALAQWAVEDDLPLLGICRGIQVMNVALGGTLVQDIPSQLRTDLQHDLNTKEHPRSTRLHPVTITGESRIGAILGRGDVEVNSLHHQAIDKLAPGAVATSYSPDGIVESLELPDKHFALAVQWHPEDLQDDERMRKLYQEFVDAARARMK